MADRAAIGWAAGWRRWADFMARRRAEAELRALGPRELLDLGLDRGGIGHAARHGREEGGRQPPASSR